MKRFIFLSLLLAILTNCKENRTKPASEIEMLVGKWKLSAIEKTVGGQKQWENVPDEQQTLLHIRYDGVILDSKELPICCGPNSYVLDGVVFNIKPKESLPQNPQCLLVDCVGCPQWKIQIVNDEIIVEPCNVLPSLKYKRAL